MLKNKIFIDNNIYLLWGLLIRSDLYKKSIYYLWPIIMNYQIIFHEDYIISFMLVILAKKYKYLNRFAILHLIHQNSISNNYITNNEYYLSILFFANIINDYHLKNNPKDINILINFINLFKYCFQYGKKFFPNLFYYIIQNILNNEYLSNNEKKNLLNEVNITNDDYNNNLYKNYKNIFNLTDYNLLLLNNNISIDSNFNISLYQISIIVYCDEFKNLANTINSLINQKFIKYEIIIIYDSNEQKNLFYIKNYIKNYPFIKLINNKTNKGMLYSISTGVLITKGKYILFLQSCYTLFNENVLKELYNKMENYNLDILEFNLLINQKKI